MSTGEVTELVQRWRDGDEHALSTLLPLVYADLRRIAAQQLRSNVGHDTLQPTALVNDVFVRLLGASRIDIDDRKHFFTTAAKLMRQVLVDRARAKSRDKRGGDWQRVDMLELAALPIDVNTDLPALDEALRTLAALDPRVAEVVELRYFAGLEVSEVAQLLGLEERTVYRDWAMARSWLRQRLSI
ncbi:MAG: sigma-70 family RNA polymerase sigma factor [Rhodanobacteraceae bacterium]|nr:sigma-70 family RNA polymerase sigma factor [Rhodanobacteraceae bacterium]